MTFRARSLPIAPEPPASGPRVRCGERSRLIGKHSMSEDEIRLSRAMYPENVKRGRPKKRSDCANGVRPCPYAACRHHLYLDELTNGTVKLNFPDREVWELEETCVLDVADRAAGDVTLDEVGRWMNLTRERVRQIESTALVKMKRWCKGKI